jgi:hypothetical protein
VIEIVLIDTPRHAYRRRRRVSASSASDSGTRQSADAAK